MRNHKFRSQASKQSARIVVDSTQHNHPSHQALDYNNKMICTLYTSLRVFEANAKCYNNKKFDANMACHRAICTPTITMKNGTKNSQPWQQIHRIPMKQFLLVRRLLRIQKNNNNRIHISHFHHGFIFELFIQYKRHRGVFMISFLSFLSLSLDKLQRLDPVPCNDHKFQCGDGACIHISFACDGEPDCSDQSDENPKECRNKGIYCVT